MKRPRLRSILFIGAVTILAFDLAVTVVVLPRYWRPLPPFGAITNEAQAAWLAEQLSVGEGTAVAGIGRFDRRLGWSYRPRAVGASGLYHINARGWRGTRGYTAEPAPGVRRIVACGDSFTFGQEVADEEAWPAVLDTMLPSAEVVNLGVGGFGTGQAFLRFQNEELGSRVDVTLIGLLLENIGRNVNRYRPRWFTSAARPVAKPRFVLEGETLRLVGQPFATRAELVAAVESGEVLDLLAADEYWDDTGVPWLLSWSGVARLVGAKRYYARRDLRTLWSDSEGEPFRTTVALLEAFHRYALDERASRLAPILIFPTMEDLAGLVERGDRYWSTLLDALDAKGIEYLDLSVSLTEAWEAREEGAPPVYVGTHLSPAANVIVAAAVRQWLSERLAR